MRLQEWIYEMEEGRGAKWVKGLAAVLAFVALAAFHDTRQFKNFDQEEPMDLAQVGRNISEGRGFTTDYIRPIDLFQLKKRGRVNLSGTNLPDIANAPVYPALLAAVFKVAPVKFEIDTTGKSGFQRYTPEIWIACLNQAILLLTLILVFRLGCRWFDSSVGWIAALILGTSEFLWHCTISGTPILLLMLIFVICLCLLPGDRDPSIETADRPGRRALLMGLLIGLGFLTRYSFGSLLIPAVLFWGRRETGARRVRTLVLLLVSFGVVAAPWLVRNFQLSGSCLGTAGYSVYETTSGFPDETLARSMDPGLDKFSAGDGVEKLLLNTKASLSQELPRLGGSWMFSFFLVGMLVPFRSAFLGKARWFIVTGLAIAVLMQGLGKTHLSAGANHLSSEQWTVVFTPGVVLLGVALFFSLVAQLESGNLLRPVLTSIFVTTMSLPLLFTFFLPKTPGTAYPPYYPPVIGETAGWMEPGEWTMTDVPWAWAWYGHRRAIWLTLNAKGDFARVHQEIHPVSAIYLTPRTLDQSFLTQILRDKDGWGELVLSSTTRGELPGKFPLTAMWTDIFPDQFFLTNRERWGTKNGR